MDNLSEPVITIFPIEYKVTHANSCAGQMLEKFTEGFLELNEKFVIVYCSKELANLSMRSVNDILGVNFWEFTAQATNLKWLSMFEQELKENHTFKAKHFFPESDRWLALTMNVAEDTTSVYLRDISKEEKICEQLGKEKQQFTQLFNCSPIPQWIYDAETLKFLDVNLAAIHQYGYSREEFLHMTLDKVIPEIEQHTLKHYLLPNKLKTNLPHQYVVNHLHKNGEVRQVRIESNSITFLGINAKLVLALDCTAHHNAEQALAENENRFKALVQNGSDLITILDDAFNYTYVNESSKSILKLTPAQLVGKNAFDLVHPDDRENVMLELAKLEANKQLKLSPFRYANGEKKYRWIESIVTDMRSVSSIRGIVTNSRDITENIVNRIKMHESIERYDIVSKATSDTIWDWDLKTGKITWNKGIKGIFGLKKIIYNVDWFLEQVHPEDVHQNVIKEYKNTLDQGKSRLTRQYRFRCEDGSYKSILDRSFIIFDSAKKPIRMIGSMQDITHKINYIKAIEQQNKKLQEISWLQSHAVRAPLASILGLTQLIDDRSLNDSDCRQLFSHLQSSAKKLDTVIANIIHTAKE